ncbi:unnamed protein product [Penicillium pancosmium]
MTTETKDKMEGTAQIKSVDMTEDMQQEAIALAIEAMEKYHIEKDIAQYIKKEVRSLPALPLPTPSLINPSSSTLERALPGTALLAGTLAAS